MLGAVNADLSTDLSTGSNSSEFPKSSVARLSLAPGDGQRGMGEPWQHLAFIGEGEPRRSCHFNELETGFAFGRQKSQVQILSPRPI